MKMSVCKSIAILFSFLAAAKVTEAGSYNSMLEAQFLNVTQDIKIGAAELDTDVEDFGIIEVRLNLICIVILSKFYTRKLNMCLLLSNI